MSFRPLSASVGSSGSAADRFAVATASALILPALICGITAAAGSTAMSALPREQRGHRRARAGVRHVDDARAALGRQRLHRQVRDAAGAHRRVVVLAGVLLHQRDQLVGARDAERHRNDEDARLRRGDADQLEVLGGVVRHLLEQQRVDAERAGDADADGRAVGRRLGDRVGAEVAARARLVVDRPSAGRCAWRACRRRCGR